MVAWTTVVRMGLNEVVGICMMFEGESQDLLIDLDVRYGEKRERQILSF